MATSSFDDKKSLEFISKEIDEKVIPTLEKYIKIPNQSPIFDAEWRQNGYLQQAVDLYAEWAKSQKIGTVEVRKTTSIDVRFTNSKTNTN